jgi:hypothetical protein
MRRADDVIRVVADDDDDDIVRDGERVRVPVLLMDSTRPTFDAAAHQPGFRTDAESYLRAYREYCRDAGHSSLDCVSAADARAERSRWISDMQRAWRMDARKRQPDPDEEPDDGDDDDGREPLGSDGQYNRQFRSRRKIGQTALPFESHADARMAARDAYDSMCSRLRSAWRMPVARPASDASQPDLSTPPDELMRRHTSDPADPADVQARRDRIYRDYTTALSEAWKNPPGVHPGESAIMSGGPKSMVVEPARGRTDPAAARQHEGEIERWKGGR